MYTRSAYLDKKRLRRAYLHVPESACGVLVLCGTAHPWTLGP